MDCKPLGWVGRARDDLRDFPVNARRIAGKELLRVQLGHDPRDWKHMTSIGPGVREIRIRTDREHRLIYVAKFAEAIYVLHAFTKKSRSTAQRDIDIAGIRYRQVIESRGKP